VIKEEWSSMHEKKQRDQQDKEPRLRRADYAIKDPEPEKEEGDVVKSGGLGGDRGGNLPMY
jgi:hypothetical protein